MLVLLSGLLALATPARADDYADVNKLIQAGRLADALARTEKHLATKPRDPQMRFLQGVIYSETGRTADAQAAFTSLTQDYPELPEPYNNLAVIYAAQNQFDMARAALEMAVRNDPGYATAHENLGDIHVQLARQSYDRAQQIDRNRPQLAPKLNLVRQLLSINQPVRLSPPPGSTPAKK